MPNPVLAKSKAFTQPGYHQVPPSPYDQPTGPNQWEQSPSNQWAPGTMPPPTWQAPTPQPTQKVMTLDDVLTKTALTIATVIVVALGSVWVTMSLNIVTLESLIVAGTVSMLAVLVVSIVATVRRKVGPVLAIVFAILEGVALGSISLIFELFFPGIVFQAVIATFIAVALTLVAFKFGKFRLTSKMRKIVMMSMMSFVGVALVSFVLRLLGINLGLFPGPGESVSWLAWLIAGLGVVLAVLSLVDDFQFIEHGIANRLPASESWRAAFGLTVTLVWLYINLLRILSYLRR